MQSEEQVLLSTLSPQHKLNQDFSRYAEISPDTPTKAMSSELCLGQHSSDPPQSVPFQCCHPYPCSPVFPHQHSSLCCHLESSGVTWINLDKRNQNTAGLILPLPGSPQQPQNSCWRHILGLQPQGRGFDKALKIRTQSPPTPSSSDDLLLPSEDSPQKWATLVCSRIRDSSSTGCRRLASVCSSVVSARLAAEVVALLDTWLMLLVDLATLRRCLEVLKEVKSPYKHFF